ncbi:MAG: hypothetical protein U9P72_04215 [Campylobacterota bacterium]|nr:hypothetical protein [Campylobacterota bacterium]
MKTILKITIASSLLCGATFAQEIEEKRDRVPSVRDAIQTISEIEQEDVTVVSGVKRMFKYGKISGELSSIYSGYYNENATNNYATAVGTQLKYELAEFKGLNAGVALSLSQDIGAFSGENDKYNPELSSDDKFYAEIGEAYINYKYQNFNFRGGRQVIDTPLADSDDIRMIPNSFEAYIANYEQDDFSFMAGALTKWQGVDSGLDVDKHWQKTGEDGTYFGGLSYVNDVLEGSVWYYDISADAVDNIANKTLYADIFANYKISDDFSLYGGVQYLTQSEVENSGIESNIYGVMAEFIAYDIGFNIAYNKSTQQANKGSFSGFGGGTLFTNMDSMIIDAITIDREVDVIVAGLSYSVGDFNFLYAYGNFDGGANSASQKEHIIEQDIAIEYTPNDDFTIASVYTINEDKEDTDSNGGDWSNFRILLSYNFQTDFKKRR